MLDVNIVIVVVVVVVVEECSSSLGGVGYGPVEVLGGYYDGWATRGTFLCHDRTVGTDIVPVRTHIP